MALAPSAREAASAHGVNSDNVRRYARKLLARPMVDLKYKGEAGWLPVPPVRAPLIVESSESLTGNFLPISYPG